MILSRFNIQGHDEGTASPESIWAHNHFAVVLIHNLFHDNKAEAKTLTVLLRCPFHFAKTVKYARHLLARNAFARIIHCDSHLCLFHGVLHVDHDLPFNCEFQCVLHQVNDNLLNSSTVTKQNRYVILQGALMFIIVINWAVLDLHSKADFLAKSHGAKHTLDQFYDVYHVKRHPF